MTSVNNVLKSNLFYLSFLIMKLLVEFMPEMYEEATDGGGGGAATVSRCHCDHHLALHGHCDLKASAAC